MTGSTYGQQFRDIDQSADPQRAVQYLDAASARPDIAAAKVRSIELMRLRLGGRGLDVGCGMGAETRAIAGVVGGEGRAVGVDGSATMIAEAAKRSAADGVSTEFLVCDAAALEFPDESFDAVRIERTLIHVDSPTAVIAALIRVTRRGGRVVVMEPDFGGTIIDLPRPELWHRVQGWMRGNVTRNAWVGRELFRLLMDAGLDDVTVEAIPLLVYGLKATERQRDQHRLSVEAAREAGVVSDDEASVLIAGLEAALAGGRWLSFSPLFLVAGTKP